MLTQKLQTIRSAGARVTENADLAPRTYWRMGGPADALVQVRTLEQLQLVRRELGDTSFFVLGNGSNLLISDKGIRGVVITLGGELAKAERAGDLLRVGAGMKIATLLNRARRNEWPGLQALAGIPGTLGGAVRMNAGASLGEVVDILDHVELVLADGSLARLATSDLHMAYRTSQLPPGGIVAAAVLKLGGDLAESLAAIDHHLARREATQPLEFPSCGSTFRNPTGDYAGRLIEASGLKGFQIGQVQVSPKHANFLVNLGGASASDARALIEHIQDEVARQHGVRLVREVHFAGDWSE